VTAPRVQGAAVAGICQESFGHAVCALVGGKADVDRGDTEGREEVVGRAAGMMNERRDQYAALVTRGMGKRIGRIGFRTGKGCCEENLACHLGDPPAVKPDRTIEIVDQRQRAAQAIRLDRVFDVHRSRAEMEFAAAAPSFPGGRTVSPPVTRSWGWCGPARGTPTASRSAAAFIRRRRSGASGRGGFSRTPIS